VKQTKPIRLSSRWLGQWRYFTIVVYSILMLLIIGNFLRGATSLAEWLEAIGMSGLYIYSFVILWRMSNKLQRISFDDRFAYIQLKGQELLIPLENIRDVELKTMFGTYEITLYTPEQLGDKFYFKVSLLYPLNHKSKETLIDRFWAAIERAKRKKQDFQRNALMS
jgi:hypothetical protein